ncbi:hypothetical protein EON64_07155, partial [archaeon]
MSTITSFVTILRIIVLYFPITFYLTVLWQDGHEDCVAYLAIGYIISQLLSSSLSSTPPNLDDIIPLSISPLLLALLMKPVSFDTSTEDFNLAVGVIACSPLVHSAALPSKLFTSPDEAKHGTAVLRPFYIRIGYFTLCFNLLVCLQVNFVYAIALLLFTWQLSLLHAHTTLSKHELTFYYLALAYTLYDVHYFTPASSDALLSGRVAVWVSELALLSLASALLLYQVLVHLLLHLYSTVGGSNRLRVLYVSVAWVFSRYTWPHASVVLGGVSPLSYATLLLEHYLHLHHPYSLLHLLGYWLLCVGLGVALIPPLTQRLQLPPRVSRKLFHLLLVLILAPYT